MGKAFEALQHWLDALCRNKWFPLYGNGIFILAIVIAKFGAGFTWRQVLVGCVAGVLWHEGSKLLLRAQSKPKFRRIQFRIGLTHFPQALVNADLYTEDEVRQNDSALWNALGRYSSGYINFTWLQQDLFFMNTASFFSVTAELTLGLKAFGARASKIRGQLPDCLELRDDDTGYELVLIRSENRGRSDDEPERPTLTLMKLPHEFFSALQEHGDSYRSVRQAFRRQREILERVGLQYWQDSEVSSAWDYRGEYADLHWWTF
jgi:hypothetical protein